MFTTLTLDFHASFGSFINKFLNLYILGQMRHVLMGSNPCQLLTENHLRGSYAKFFSFPFNVDLCRLR
jgi:hypothetical protein